MGVIYFLVCVRRYETNLPTNIYLHDSGEENSQIQREMRPFESNHILVLFYDSMVCFLLPKCVFFYQWCLSGLSSQHYVSIIFDNQDFHHNITLAFQ